MTDDYDRMLFAFQDETAAFTAALSGLAAPLWDRPTRCEAWRVRDVVGHVITVLARVPAMVAAPAPERADTTAITYYRGDERFSAAVNADRVHSAHSRAAVSDVSVLVDDLAGIAQEVVLSCGRQPADRIVRTRHGDAMLLSEFLLTRLFETAVHGIDVADAVDQPSWLTASATHHLQRMLFGTDRRAAVSTLGADAVMAVRKATGRTFATGKESAQPDEWATQRLTLT